MRTPYSGVNKGPVTTVYENLYMFLVISKPYIFYRVRRKRWKVIEPTFLQLSVELDAWRTKPNPWYRFPSTEYPLFWSLRDGRTIK